MCHIEYDDSSLHGDTCYIKCRQNNLQRLKHLNYKLRGIEAEDDDDDADDNDDDDDDDDDIIYYSRYCA